MGTIQCRWRRVLLVAVCFIGLQVGMMAAGGRGLVAGEEQPTAPVTPQVKPLSAKLLRQFLNTRFYQDLVLDPKDTDYQTAIIAQPFIAQFCGRVLRLKEFGGDQEEKDGAWTPLETQMLTMLRTAVKSNPFFTQTQFELVQRDIALNQLWDQEHAIRMPVPEELTAAMAAMDNAVYKQTAEAFRTWAAAQMAQQPAWQVQRYTALQRMAWLLANIANHAKYTQMTIPQRQQWARAQRSIQQALESKRKEIAQEKIPAELFAADSLAGKFWQYFEQAQKTNPCFADLTAPLDEGEFQRQYMAYTKKGDAAAELAALDALMKAVQGGQ